MGARKVVQTTVRLTEKDSILFDKAAEQLQISKSELFIRSARFCLSNRNDDDNSFILPEMTVKNVLDRFTRLIEERALETASTAVNDPSTKGETMPAYRKFCRDYVKNLEVAKGV